MRLVLFLFCVCIAYGEEVHDTVIEDKENVDVPATQRAPVGGWEYEHGYELLQSSEDGVQEGIKYINESAKMGNPDAQFLMAVSHATGVWGDARMEAFTVLNYYFSAMGGNIPAMMALGARHHAGIDVPENCKSALAYYEMAGRKTMELRNANSADAILDDLKHSRIATSLQGGKGPNDAEVLAYYQYSADKGEPDAALNLGNVYYLGLRGVEQDLGIAVKHFTRAVELGSIKAMAIMGHMYLHGIVVEQNTKVAFTNFEVSASKKSFGGLYGLGYMTVHGIETIQDTKLAITLLKEAAQLGSPDALYLLGEIYAGEVGNQESNFELAAQHYFIAAQHSHTEAIYKLAQMYKEGIGKELSCQKAVKHFKIVSERGPSSKAMRQAFKDFENKNYHKAFTAYIALAEQGFEIAQENAAWMIDMGHGYSGLDHGVVSVHLYKNAAAQGNVEANLKIGDYFYFGRGGLEINYERATSFYRRASKRQNAQAMFNLGIMHEHGIGMTKDYFLAKRWYDMAAESSADAKYPVAMALFKLRIHMMYRSFLAYFESDTNETNDAPIHIQSNDHENKGIEDKSSFSQQSTNNQGEGASDEKESVVEKSDFWTWLKGAKSFVIDKFYFDMGTENIVLTVLIVALIYVISVRYEL